ncbi:putative membrane protein (plasmid) [Burkholderia cepacia]|nr:putative membrane protein [Burkholderia cepacia]
MLCAARCCSASQMLVYGQPVAPGVGATAAMVGLLHNF